MADEIQLWHGKALKENLKKQKNIRLNTGIEEIDLDKIDVDSFYSVKKIPEAMKSYAEKDETEYYLKDYKIGLDCYLYQENLKRLDKGDLKNEDIRSLERKFLYACLKAGFQDDFGIGVAKDLSEKIKKGSIKFGIDGERYEKELVNKYNDKLKLEYGLIKLEKVNVLEVPGVKEYVDCFNKGKEYAPDRKTMEKLNDYINELNKKNEAKKGTGKSGSALEKLYDIPYMASFVEAVKVMKKMNPKKEVMEIWGKYMGNKNEEKKKTGNKR